MRWSHAIIMKGRVGERMGKKNRDFDLVRIYKQVQIGKRTFSQIFCFRVMVLGWRPLPFNLSPAPGPKWDVPSSPMHGSWVQPWSSSVKLRLPRKTVLRDASCICHCCFLTLGICSRVLYKYRGGGGCSHIVKAEWDMNICTTPQWYFFRGSHPPELVGSKALSDCPLPLSYDMKLDDRGVIVVRVLTLLFFFRTLTYSSTSLGHSFFFFDVFFWKFLDLFELVINLSVRCTWSRVIICLVGCDGRWGLLLTFTWQIWFATGGVCGIRHHIETNDTAGLG